MRFLGSLLLGAAVPCLGGEEESEGPDRSYHKVTRRDPDLPAFDRSVLGNAADASKGPPTFVREHMFIADISVGTPPQTMKCLLDSGTADIWIPSRRCTSCEQGHHFHADQSDTFMPAVASTPQGLMPVPVRMDYSTGEVVGFLVQDTISLGWTEITNQSFLIVEEAKLPEHREWDGICGLGWHQMAADGTGQPLYRHFQPMYKNMERNHLRPVFSLVPARDRQAYIVVGEVPTAAFKEDTLQMLKAEPLVEGQLKSFWVVKGRVSASEKTEYSGRFLVDTASPFLLVPSQFFAQFVGELFPDGHFDQFCGSDPSAHSLVVCECLDEEVEVWITLGSRSFRLGSDRLFKRVPAADGKEDLCLLRIQRNPLTTADPLELLGDLLAGQDALPDHGDDDAEFPLGDDQPFVMPTLPFLIPIAQALSNASFMNSSGGGAPISITGLPAGLLPPGPILPLVPGEEQVEEIVVTNPEDGSICETTLVWGDKGLIRNTTKCHGGSTEQDKKKASRRRLTGQGIMEDVWVLGGPFLEHFVTIMDFEKASIGFAEPIQQDGSQLERAIQLANPLATQTFQDKRMSTADTGPTVVEEGKSGGGGGFPWGVLVVLTCFAMVGGAFCRFQQKTKQRKNLAETFQGDAEQQRMEEDAVAAE